MSSHEEGIIREVSDACKMVQMHGCSIDLTIKRFGHTTVIKVTPNGGTVKIDDMPTQILPPQGEPSA